ncbi:MAG TPA: hypothetical protein VII06_15105 [Chloroflexota bacterium]|jgi:hypothetical protein
MARHPAWHFLTLLLALIMGLAGCAPAAPAPRPTDSAAPPPTGRGAGSAASNPQLAALTDAARREGQLAVVWAGGVLGGQEGMQRMTEAFNRHYGLDITL